MQGAQAGSGAWELRSASPLAQPSPSNKKSRIPSSLGKLDQGTTLGSQSLVASSSGLCLWECWLHACLTVVTKPEIRGLNQAGTCFSPIQQPHASGSEQTGWLWSARGAATRGLIHCALHRGFVMLLALFLTISSAPGRRQSGGCSPPGSSWKVAHVVASLLARPWCSHVWLQRRLGKRGLRLYDHINSQSPLLREQRRWAWVLLYAP